MKKNKVVISMNANTCQFESGPHRILQEIFEKFKIRHPNAFYIKMRNPHFDGYIKYISPKGNFKLGFLPSVVKEFENNNCEVTVIDRRPKLNKPEIPLTLGDKELRDIQLESIQSVFSNRICGLPFYVGVLNEATNFGKTLVMAAIHESFERKERTIVLLNNSKIFEQTKKEIPKLLPKEDIKWVRGKDLKFGNFTIAMVQTLANNISELKYELEKVRLLLVDEADVSDNKTYQTCILHLYNTVLRIGLSGSIYLSKLKKHQMKNMNIKSFFGEELHITTKKEMMDKGFSSKIVVKICQGNSRNTDCDEVNYFNAFKSQVIDNKVAHKFSLDRLKYNIKYNRLPALIVVQFIKHADKLYGYIKKALGDKYNIQKMDHTTKNAESILEDFEKGKIDILIITFIVKRGLNLPIANYLQNAAGSDSNETIKQLMGRMERKSEKKLKHIDDLYYFGKYLKRHSNHRVNYYLKEQVKVINLIKKNLKNLY